MVRTLVHLLLVVAVTLGSPAAACCRLAALAHQAGLGGSAHAAYGAVESCCSCCEEAHESPAPGRDEPGRPCDCGSGTSLIAESGAGKTVGAWSAALPLTPPVFEFVPPASSFMIAPAPTRERPPPRCSLLALHCSLTV